MTPEYEETEQQHRQHQELIRSILDSEHTETDRLCGLIRSGTPSEAQAILGSAIALKHHYAREHEACQRAVEVADNRLMQAKQRVEKVLIAIADRALRDAVQRHDLA